jgi:hypothetical protein
MLSNRTITRSPSAFTTKDVVVNGIRVNELVEVFEALGYECKVGTRLTGTSGVEHDFDIIATMGSEIVVIDMIVFRASILDTPASDFEISDILANEAVRMRVKSWDCKPYARIIIHLSSYLCNSENGVSNRHDPLQRFLNEFEINLIQAADIPAAAKKLQVLLSQVEAA